MALNETDLEINSLSGSSFTAFKIGETVYDKYFDTGSQKWERWSGSGAPYIRLIPSLEDSATNSIRVNIVAGDVELGTVGITGSIGLSVTGSNVIKIVGIDITGSVTLPVSLVGTAISGSVGLTGSTQLPSSLTTGGSLKVAILEGMSGRTTSGAMYVSGSVNVSGSELSVDARQSGSWNITGGSIGITGSGTLNLQGSVGITGSEILDIELRITGSDIALGVTGSVDARQSGSWNLNGGSIGITGSGILNTLVTNTGSVPVKVQLTNSTGLSLPLDEDAGILAGIDIDHYMIHSGSHFFVNDVSSGSVGVPKNWLFVSPATGEVHSYIQTSNAAAGTWRFWEDIPVSNSGSQGTAYNNNRQSAKTAGLKVYSNPVTGSGGTLIALFYVGTITQGNAKPGGLAERNQEAILKTGSRYVLQWEPDSGNVICSINAQWYEVA
jgi:hypothetical protein